MSLVREKSASSSQRAHWSHCEADSINVPKRKKCVVDNSEPNEKRKMLKRGIEPQTFALLARRSNQLSYSSLLKPPPFPICAHRLPSHKAQTGIR